MPETVKPPGRDVVRVWNEIPRRQGARAIIGG